MILHQKKYSQAIFLNLAKKLTRAYPFFAQLPHSDADKKIGGVFSTDYLRPPSQMSRLLVMSMEPCAAWRLRRFEKFAAKDPFDAMC